MAAPVTPLHSAQSQLERLRCDLFCEVIDHFGDAGVAWRLGRQLAREQGWQVRIAIDRPEVLSRLRPQLQAHPEFAHIPQAIDGVYITGFDHPTPPADIVIEAFGCRAPAAYRAAMAHCSRPPVWINLEYLSTEDWVDECHGLPSPDPGTGMQRHFYFPGFTKGSGGLIREFGVGQAHPDPTAQRGFLCQLVPPSAPDWNPDALQVSLLCYPAAPLDEMLAQWQSSSSPVHCFATAGLAPEVLQKLLASATGALRVTPLPFLPPDDYDRLLAACDLNFVRGEDSFVRAQWAGKAFVWQAYLQDDHAHHAKVNAFLQRLFPSHEVPGLTATRDLWLGWNGLAPLGVSTWHRAWLEHHAYRQHCLNWRQTLLQTEDLASQLARFCRSAMQPEK